MNRTGMNTATSDRLMLMTVNPICFDPASAACIGVIPRS